MLKLWFIWKAKAVKLTDETDCIWPDANIAFRVHFESKYAVQDLVNILRVEGIKVDVTDLEYAS